MKSFAEEILEGIPAHLPAEKPIDPAINHAPKRKAILNSEEKNLHLKTHYVISQKNNMRY